MWNMCYHYVKIIQSVQSSLAKLREEIFVCSVTRSISCLSYISVYTCRESWHDDVIKWKHFPRYWSFVRGIHRSPVNSPHKDQWRGALMFCLICVWINGWVNNREAGDLRRYRAHYDVTVMTYRMSSDRCMPWTQTYDCLWLWLHFLFEQANAMLNLLTQVFVQPRHN